MPTLHKHLRRLTRVWTNTPTHFITFCTYNRRKILADPEIFSILYDVTKESLDRYGWEVGRYVAMPDHVHMLCAPALENARSLSMFMQAWKQWTSKRIVRELSFAPPVWQREFHDRVLRSADNPGRFIEYMAQNPVRAGLAKRPEDWPYKGGIFTFE